VRIASSCDFASAKRETGHPPPYASEKEFMPDAMRTIEDTLRDLEPELRKLSLDIHGERRDHNEHTDTDALSDHPELQFEERLVFLAYQRHDAGG
jgi:hypothetical protein